MAKHPKMNDITKVSIAGGSNFIALLIDLHPLILTLTALITGIYIAFKLYRDVLLFMVDLKEIRKKRKVKRKK